jgi:hypothetical protein
MPSITQILIIAFTKRALVLATPVISNRLNKVHHRGSLDYFEALAQGELAETQYVE